MKTYRLNPETVRQLESLKGYYADSGLSLSYTQIVQKAVDTLYYEMQQKAINKLLTSFEEEEG